MKLAFSGNLHAKSVEMENLNGPIAAGPKQLLATRTQHIICLKRAPKQKGRVVVWVTGGEGKREAATACAAEILEKCRPS